MLCGDVACTMLRRFVLDSWDRWTFRELDKTCNAVVFIGASFFREQGGLERRDGVTVGGGNFFKWRCAGSHGGNKFGRIVESCWVVSWK